MKRMILCLILTLPTLGFGQSEMGQTETAITKLSNDSYHINLDLCDGSTNPNIHMHTGGRITANKTEEANLNKQCNWRVNVSRKCISVIVEKFYIGHNKSVCDTSTFAKMTMTDLALRASYTYEACSEPKVYASLSENFFNFETLVISSYGHKFMFLEMRIVATDRTVLYTLNTTSVTPNMGYITSFGFDRRTHYADRTTVSFKLTLTHADLFMISFPHFDIEESLGCQFDFLNFFYSDMDKYTEDALWKICGYQDVPPQIHSRSADLQFFAGLRGSRTGFKMIYTFHNMSEEPMQVREGVFNCSTPAFTTFQAHLRCNLDVECEGGEDEMDCLFSTNDCPEHFIHSGSACYRYVKTVDKIAWYDAYTMCIDHGLTLASPKTPREWNDFRKIISYGKRTAYVPVGAAASSLKRPPMYREVWEWADATMAYYINIREHRLAKPLCAHIPPINSDVLVTSGCGSAKYTIFVLCEGATTLTLNQTLPTLTFPVANTTATEFKHESVWACPGGHVTLDFLSCDSSANCGISDGVTECSTTAGVFPMFKCDGRLQTVHYTLVCDHKRDCLDGSDETFCEFRRCPERRCQNKQCVTTRQWCDGMQDCTDGSDEQCPQFVSNVTPSLAPPSVVNLKGDGVYTQTPMSLGQPCPVTHFRCPEGYCLPVYLRCNGVYDCPGWEDEMGCSQYTCPGFYRCQGSSVCVHADHICDGYLQCPQNDDEVFCSLECPEGCTCQGLAYRCNQSFPAHNHTELRYLDASGTAMTLSDLTHNFYLVGVKLSSCSLQTLPLVTLHNLRALSLTDNNISELSSASFFGFKNLQNLYLSGNPLESFVGAAVENQMRQLYFLDLSRTMIEIYSSDMLRNFPRLKGLNLSHGSLKTIGDAVFDTLPHLELIDVRGSPLEQFPRDLLRDLASLQTVYSSNFKLCCSAVLPENFNAKNCYSPVDELSSCDDLLRSNVYRIFLWFMALAAIVGNLGSIIGRYVTRGKSSKSFNVFVTNLCMADLLMGVYLTMIGSADVAYKGTYLWYDRAWKESATCMTAGFLSLLSSEVSAFFICLITVDRLIVTRFPFSSLHFRTRSASVACATSWVFGVALAAIPLVMTKLNWQFYSQTGICIPLPVTRSNFSGRPYAFGVMVVLNFILFSLIGIGQMFIYVSVRQNSLLTENAASRDAAIARRLTTIVVSDFLCWFPIGLLGLLASTGNPIPGEINVAMAIFVLPLNSALNPFLYTFNVIMEKRREAAEARMLEHLMKKVTDRTPV